MPFRYILYWFYYATNSLSKCWNFFSENFTATVGAAKWLRRDYKSCVDQKCNSPSSTKCEANNCVQCRGTMRAMYLYPSRGCDWREEKRNRSIEERHSAMDPGIPNANENVKSRMEKRILLELRNTDPREVRAKLRGFEITRTSLIPPSSPDPCAFCYFCSSESWFWMTVTLRASQAWRRSFWTWRYCLSST